MPASCWRPRSVSILLDPVLSYTYETQISRYTYDDLPERIDFALITHNHQDHILFETLLRLRHRIGQHRRASQRPRALQDPSLKLILENCGFRNIVEVSDMDELVFDGVSITAIPFIGEHADLNIASKSAYLVHDQRSHPSVRGRFMQHLPEDVRTRP